jgi:hypothetical protein
MRLNTQVLELHSPYNEILRRQSPDLYKVLRPYLWHELFLKTAGEPGWLAALYKWPVGYPAIAIARRFTNTQRCSADK